MRVNATGRRVAAGVAATALLLSVAGGCRGDDNSVTPSTTGATTGTTAQTSPTLSQDKAIEIARAEVLAAFPDYDLTERRANVLVKGDNYEVSFPIVDRVVHAGEPHIVLNRRTGEIVERFMTD